MKNIHILPTDKPSRLRYNLSNVLALTKEPYRDYRKQVNQHIYITSDVEIKEGDWVIKISSLYKGGGIAQKYSFIDAQFEDIIFKKIILTTDQDLIKDGVQAIDDKFLEWFVKNPSCEEVEVGYGWIRLTETNNEGYWVSIPDNQFEIQQAEPKQDYSGVHLRHCYQGEYEDGCKYGENDCPAKPLEPKQETLEEAAENEASIFYEKGTIEWNKYRQVFELGSKWQAERMYSKEDLEEAFKAGREGDMVFNNESPKYWDFNEWFEQSKKK